MTEPWKNVLGIVESPGIFSVSKLLETLSMII